MGYYIGISVGSSIINTETPILWFDVRVGVNDNTNYLNQISTSINNSYV